MDDTDISPSCLSVAKVAKRLSMSRGLVYKLIHSGHIPHILIAGMYRVPTDVVDRLATKGSAGIKEETRAH